MDASGSRARPTGGCGSWLEFVLSLLALSLPVSCSLAAAPPRPGAIGPTTSATALASRVLEDETSGLRGRPSVAFDGKEFLVAWLDERRRLGTGEGPAEILAARLDSTGAPLGGTTVAVALVPHLSGFQSPVVLSCKGLWLVLWGSSANTFPGHIYALRLAPDGRRLDAAPYQLTSSARAHGVTGACDGDSALVAWSESTPELSTSLSIAGARLVLSAPALEATRFRVSPRPDDQYSAAFAVSLSPAVVFDGSAYVVAWLANGQGSSYPDRVFSMRLNRDGQRLSEMPLCLTQTSASVSGLAAETSGKGHVLLVWSSVVSDKGHARLGLRLQEGLPRDSAPVLLDPTVSYQNTSPLMVAPDEKGYRVSWITADHRHISSVHVGSVGAPTALPEALLERGTAQPHPPLRIGDARVIAAAGKHLAVWREGQMRGPRSEDEQVQIMAGWLGLDATKRGTPKGVAVSFNAQLDVSIASRGSEHLAIWIDSRGGLRRVFGAWLDARGARMGGDFLISPGDLGACQAPRVIAGKRGYLVLWEGELQHKDGARDTGLLGLYLSPNAQPPEPRPALLRRTVGGAGSYHAVAEGGEFLIAFFNSSLSYVRWPEGQAPGKAAGVPFPRSKAVHRVTPGLACTGGECLVATGAVVGGDPWIEGGVLGQPAQKLLDLPVNHFVQRLAAYPSAQGPKVTWIERDGEGHRLRWGRLYRGMTSLEPAAVGAPLPVPCCGSLSAARTARGEVFFVVARPLDQPATAYAYELRGEELKGGRFLDATQLSVTENPAGGLAAAFIRFDPDTASNRASAALIDDELHAPQ